MTGGQQDGALPSRREILHSALDSLDTGRSGLSQARDWLASDWAGGDSIPRGAAPHWQQARKKIAEAKALVDAAKNALYDALDAEPAPAAPTLDAELLSRPDVQECAQRLMDIAAAYKSGRRRRPLDVVRDIGDEKAREQLRLGRLLDIDPFDLVAEPTVVYVVPDRREQRHQRFPAPDSPEGRQVIARRDWGAVPGDSEPQGGGDDDE